MTDERLLNVALDAAKLAGEQVLSFYRQRNFTSEIKADDSPVTSADLAANATIMEQLQTLTPDIPIISEEVGPLPLAERGKWQRYWLLDPIDGTGEFIIGSGDFAVNIALVENGWPTIGVIHAPDHHLTYFAQQGLGAFKDNGHASKQISVAPYTQERPIKVAISRRQELGLMGQYLNSDFNFEHIALGSCSLKKLLNCRRWC